MTTLPAAGAVTETSTPVRPPALDSSDSRSVRSRLAGIATGHAVVDFFSAFVIPLLSVLEGRLHLDPGQGAILIALGSVCSGGVQPIIAWLSDRYDTRVLGTLGLVVAALAVGSVGFAQNYTQLLLIQAVGTAGIGAFHPVAAAAMGHLAGARRSLGIAVFFTAGMVGAISGNFFAPFWVKHFGLQALAWTILPGLAAALVLGWAMHSAPHRHADAGSNHLVLSAPERARRWRAVAILYCGNVARFSVNMALVQLLVRWSEGVALDRAGATTLDQTLRIQASTLNGLMQGALAIGMGIGGLWIGTTLRVRHEKAALVLVPTLGAGAVLALPHTVGPAAFALAVLCGIGFAGVIPLTIALAQRLLPHRTSLASGLMMGGAWMVASVAPPVAQRLIREIGLVHSFELTGALLLLAGVLALPLPGRLLRETAGG